MTPSFFSQSRVPPYPTHRTLIGGIGITTMMKKPFACLCLVTGAVAFAPQDAIKSSAATRRQIRASTSDDPSLLTLLADDESRRRIFTNSISTLIGSATAAAFVNPSPANAELIQFPITEANPLKNKYNFMRAGESLLEEEGIWGSNPLFLTNRENALSENGIAQVHGVCDEMMRNDFQPTVILYPTSANSIDTANIVATDMRVGRNRVMPEYTNLDGRGIGKFDMNEREAVRAAIWALDADSGPEGRTGDRPPPNDDGTPNETLANQITRLRQLMAVCETNFSGDDVLFIFPDNCGPALLSCLIAGVDLNRVHELEFSPGEIRYDITRDNTLERLSTGPTPGYVKTIQDGRIQLANLKQNPSLLINVKEKRQLEEMKGEEERLRAVKEKEVERKAARDAAAKKSSDENFAIKTSGTSKFKPSTVNKYAVKREEGSSDFGDVLPLTALGLAAGMAILNGGKEEPQKTQTLSSEKLVEEKPKSVALADQALDDSSRNIHLADQALGDTSTDVKEDSSALDMSITSPAELQVMEELIDSHPITIPEFANFEPKEETTEEERMALAEEAMEEYMNRGDGGEEWLQSLASIMDEKD